jgi:HlyD family secretion protein
VALQAGNARVLFSGVTGHRVRISLYTSVCSASSSASSTSMPGMQVAGEIHLGTGTVLEYLLSPVTKAIHEAGLER